MNDTSPKAAELMRRLLMSRSGQDRLLMGFSMFDFARKQVEVALKAEGLVEGTVEYSGAAIFRGCRGTS
jgi:hypothetical protein